MRVFLSVSLLACTAIVASLAGLSQPPHEADAGLVTYVVNSTEDDDDGICHAPPEGDCTLREALNLLGSGDSVHFDIPESDSQCEGDVCRISVDSELPVLDSDNVVIDGYTQPGAEPNDNEFGDSINADIRIALMGHPGLNGFQIAGDGNTVRGFMIATFNTGVLIEGNENTVTGNFIGTPGDQASGANGTGVEVQGLSNTIGGLEPEGRNLISNNNVGVFVGEGATFTDVLGNYLGVDSSGSEPIPNQSVGIGVVSGPTGVDIGSLDDGGGNVIAATGLGGSPNGDAYHGAGIAVVGEPIGGFDLATLSNNIIGMSIDGDAPLGNSGHGIYVSGSDRLVAAFENTVAFNGGAGFRVESGARANLLDNEIAFNEQAGIAVVDAATRGVHVMENEIHSNGGLGIDLGDDGVTPNDIDDADDGPNDLQNAPALASALSGSLTITGSLLTGPFDIADDPHYGIHFFASDDCDPSGQGEGEEHIGFISIEPDPDGVTSFVATGDITIDPGRYVTATATIDILGVPQSTSEFSNCVEVESTATATPTPTSTPTAIATQPESTATHTPTDTPTVIATQPGPTATSTPTLAQVVGDVNCDGQVNSIDAALVLQFAANLTDSLPCEGAADVNGDGQISAVDAALILQFAAGLLSEL